MLSPSAPASAKVRHTDSDSDGSPAGSGGSQGSSPRGSAAALGLSPRNSAPRHSSKRGGSQVSVSPCVKTSPRAKIKEESEDSDSPRPSHHPKTGIRRDPSLGQKPSVSSSTDRPSVKLDTPNIYVSSHVPSNDESRSNDTLSTDDPIIITTPTPSSKTKLTKKNSIPHGDAGSRPGTPRCGSDGRTARSRGGSGGSSQPHSPKGVTPGGSQEGTPGGIKCSSLKEQRQIMEKKMAEEEEVQNEIEKLLKELHQ